MKLRLGSGLLALALMAGPIAADAANIQVSITVDNSYALFYGSAFAATNFVGTDGNWPTTETYNFNLPSDRFLYVVTASDLSTAQGFLGQFENLDAGYKFYSNDPQWQVMATGLGSAAPYSGSPANLALLTGEILDANAGGNFSDGWTDLTAGPKTGTVPGVSGRALIRLPAGSGTAAMVTSTRQHRASTTASGSFFGLRLPQHPHPFPNPARLRSWLSV